MDWQAIQPIFNWLSDHPAWSGLFVFLIALTESLVIVGLIIPGTVLMFGIGTLVGAGVLDVKLVLLLAFAGAVLGDGISFWIGRNYREQIAGVWPFKKNPQMLEKGKAFFTRHGGKSIFFGRFVGPVRPVIPAVAGMMHMPVKTFFMINVLSAAGWAPFYLAPGILFGTSIGLASAIGSRLVIILLSLVVGAALLIFIIKKSMAYTVPRLETGFSDVLRWSIRFKFVDFTLGALVDPDKDVKNALIHTVTVFFLFFLFVTILILSFWTPWIAESDRLVENVSALMRTGAADYLMWLAHVVFSWPVILLLFLNISIGLYVSGYQKSLSYFLLLVALSVFTSWLIILVYSLFVNEPVNQLGFTQLTLFIVISLFYTVLSCEKMDISKRWMVYSFAWLLVSFLAYSNIYFGLLPLSLTFLALSISVIWLSIFSLAYRRHQHQLNAYLLISASTLVVWIFSASLMYLGDYQRTIVSLPQKPITVMTEQDWLTSQWKNMPGHRTDVLGRDKQQLNIQWLATLEEIEQSLLNSGWRKSAEVTFKSLLYRMAPEPELDKIVRLPRTQNGVTETILYVKSYDAGKGTGIQQRVFQLWPTTIRINGLPLWSGSVSAQQLIYGERWLSYFSVENSNVTELLPISDFGDDWQMTVTEKIKSGGESDEKFLLIFADRNARSLSDLGDRSEGKPF